MAVVSIPVAPGVPHQSFTTTLDGARYAITLRWLQRVERWHISVATDSGTAILSGRALAWGADVLSYAHSIVGAPPGPLYVLTPDGIPSEPTLSGLGDTHYLLYEPQDE